MNESNLHEYQRACVEHIITHPFCGVFLEMGLGKTVSTLTAIEKLMYDYCSVNKVLVVAPKRVAETVWAEEAQQWDHLKHLRVSKVIGSPEKRIEALKANADIYVISRDNVYWLWKIFSQLWGSTFPFDMCVIDELSSFKSSQSKRFKSMRYLRSYMTRLVGLTGTPAPNGLIDLWPQIYLMDRGFRLGKTITSFRDTFFKPAIMCNNVVYKYALRPGSDEQIRERIKDICISMKAEDYLKMPARTDNFIKLKMPASLAKEYDKFEAESVLEFLGDSFEQSKIAEDEKREEVTALSAAALTNKLLQFANGAVYGEDENGKRVTHEVHSLKIDALREIIEDANGQPILVATSFQFDEDHIIKQLEEYHPRKLRTAEDIKDWNEGKIQLLFAHPASAGHGLNLQRGGSIIVWFGLSWSLELYQQFNGRLYRQGQTKPVVINHLVVEGTCDEDVVRALKRKGNTQDELMESIKARINKYIKNGSKK